MSAPWVAKSVIKQATFVASKFFNCHIHHAQVVPLSALMSSTSGMVLRNCDLHDDEIRDAYFYGCDFTDCLFDPPDENEDELSDYHRTLVDAVRKAVQDGVLRSRATAPVSYGKTFLIPYILDALVEDHDFHTLAVGLPWQALADQTTSGIISKLVTEKGRTNYRFIVVHSGDPHEDFTTDGRFCDVVLKTKSRDIEGIVNAYRQWRAENRCVVFLYLYKSAANLFNVLREAEIKIDFGLADEAHNLSRDLTNLQLIAQIADPALREELSITQERIAAIRSNPHPTDLDDREHRKLYSRVKSLWETSDLIPAETPIARWFFLTATPTSTAERQKRAVENTDVFGPEIYTFTFAELVERGQAVDPLIAETIVDTSLVDESYSKEDRYLLSAVIVGLQKFQAYFGNDVPVKTISYFDSVKDVEAVCGEVFRPASEFETKEDYLAYVETVETNHQRFVELVKRETGRNYRFIGCVGCQYMNVRERQRRFDAFRNADDVIFINCQVLVEGVDFPSANSELILRSADSIKAVQMFGRIVRIGDEDRDLMRRGLLIPNKELIGYKKNKAMVVICDRVKNDALGEQKELMKTVLQQYRTAGFEELRGNTETWQEENSIRINTHDLLDATNNMSEAISELSVSDITRVAVDRIGTKEVPIDDLF